MAHIHMVYSHINIWKSCHVISRETITPHVQLQPDACVHKMKLFVFALFLCLKCFHLIYGIHTSDRQDESRNSDTFWHNSNPIRLNYVWIWTSMYASQRVPFKRHHITMRHQSCEYATKSQSSTDVWTMFAQDWVGVAYHTLFHLPFKITSAEWSNAELEIPVWIKCLLAINSLC